MVVLYMCSLAADANAQYIPCRETASRPPSPTPSPGERPGDRRPPALFFGHVLELSPTSPHSLFFTFSIQDPSRQRW